MFSNAQDKQGGSFLVQFFSSKKLYSKTNTNVKTNIL